MIPETTQGFEMRPATLDDVPMIAADLLPEGIDDFRRAGFNPVLTMAIDVLSDESYVVISPDNKPCALLGIGKDGCMWMNMTNEIRRHPKAFIKCAKSWMNSLPHKLVWNAVDIQNTQLLKFLRLLGCQFLGVYPVGAKNTLYIEFVKL